MGESRESWGETSPIIKVAGNERVEMHGTTSMLFHVRPSVLIALDQFLLDFIAQLAIHIHLCVPFVPITMKA